MIPAQYRQLALTDLPLPELDFEAVRDYLLNHPVYRRTRYVAARVGEQIMVVEVIKADETDLFTPVQDVRLISDVHETIFVDRPDLDSGIPSHLARAAADHPEARCVVVRGKYEHVNFIEAEDIRTVHVLDVAPPWPAKLCDQVDRILETAEDLPATLCPAEVVDLAELAAQVPAEHYLLPCRGGQVEIQAAEISYLDEVPETRSDWVLLGCERSQQIHEHFYGDQAPQIDICPKKLAAARPLPPGQARLTKCCLTEFEIQQPDATTVVVPWGASFKLVSEGLTLASELAAGSQAEVSGDGRPAH